MQSNGRQYTLAEVQQMQREIESDADKLRRLRDKHQAKADALSEQLVALVGKDSGGNIKVRRGLPAVIRNIIAEAARPISTDDIVKAVKKSGHQTKSKNVPHLVHTSLGTLRADIQQTAEGWTLRQAPSQESNGVPSLSRASNPVSATKLVREFLGNAKGGLPAKELVNRLIAAGWTTNAAKGPRNQIYVVLAAMKASGEVKKVGDVWKLAK